MNKLGECLTIKHGWAFKGEFFAESGEQSILTPGNFYEAGGFKYNDERERYYTGEYPHEYLCKKGDLIVAMTEQVAGLLGSTAIVPKDNRYLHNQRIGLITCDEKHITKMFAYYLFMTKSVREQISRTSSGTKVKHTSPEKIYDVEVSLPDIPTQKKIAHFLWTIDCKIRNNIQINDNLQHQLKLMYDYWFTQFDFPDENGMPYRASGGAMVWNEQLKRKIPVNWKAEMLSDVFEVTMGSSPTGDSLNDNNNGIEFYQGSTDFGSLYPTERIYTTAPIRYAKQQDVLLSVRAPVGALNIAMNNCCIGRGLAAIHHESTAYAWCTLKALQPFFDILNANGTTFGALTSDDLKNHYIISPDNDVLQAFIRISKPIEEKMRVISKEIRQLSTLRDWLLPMLMNGQATISD